MIFFYWSIPNMKKIVKKKEKRNKTKINQNQTKWNKKQNNNKTHQKISPWEKSLLDEIFLKTKFHAYSIFKVVLHTLENKGSRWEWWQALSYRGANWWHYFSSEENNPPQNVIAYTESLIHAHFVHLKILFGNCQLLQTT